MKQQKKTRTFLALSQKKQALGRFQGYVCLFNQEICCTTCTGALKNGRWGQKNRHRTARNGVIAIKHGVMTARHGDNSARHGDNSARHGVIPIKHGVIVIKWPFFGHVAGVFWCK